MLLTDRRKGRRRYVAHGARIVCDGGSGLQNCRVLDVSAFGAQLELENALTLPGKFVLLLSHDGRLRRQCLVVWRKENTVGIEFNPPFPTKLNQRLQAILPRG
jgi:PilZ domain